MTVFKKCSVNLETILHRILQHVAMAYRFNHNRNIYVSVINIDIKTVNDAKILLADEDNEEGDGDDEALTHLSLFQFDVLPRFDIGLLLAPHCL